ncbi:MAG: hypothetical protein WCY71_06915 [Halothiobacillaceae bacterium]
MSEYRDWQHPEGGPSEAAPESLVDVFTAPWLDQATGGVLAPTAAVGGGGRWLAIVLALLVLALLIAAWRRRRDLVLAARLWRLERAARRLDGAFSLRELQDQSMVAIARWQHGGRAPRRDRLAGPWSDWVRVLDHQRFGHDRGDAAALAAHLRAMRRALWRLDRGSEAQA